jgi:hypothetical protein
MALGNNFVYHDQVGHGHGVLKEHLYNTKSNMLILTVRSFFHEHIPPSWHLDTTFYLRIPPGRFKVPLEDPRTNSPQEPPFVLEGSDHAHTHNHHCSLTSQPRTLNQPLDRPVHHNCALHLGVPSASSNGCP